MCTGAHTHVHMVGGCRSYVGVSLGLPFRAVLEIQNPSLMIPLSHLRNLLFFSFLNIGQFLDIKVGLRFTR